MTLRTTLAIVFAVMVSPLPQTQVRAQQAPAPLSPAWLGTWHLNVAKSTFVGPAPYVRGTWTVSRREGDEILMIYHQVGVRGGVTHMEWKGVFDGTDHRIHGPDAPVTYAYRVVDERTLQLVVKVDGRQAATARVVLGQDGVVTATTQNLVGGRQVPTITVYEKR